MAGLRLDFTSTGAIPKGGDFRRDISFKNPDGTVMNLAGCVGYARVKKDTQESTKVVAQMTVTIDDAALPAPAVPNGLVHLLIGMADMLKIPTSGVDHNSLSRYTWDFYMKWADGSYQQILYGFFDVMPRDTEIETYA